MLHAQRCYKCIYVSFYIILLFVVFSAADNIGLYGKFPCYGGNAENQQIAPSSSNNQLNSSNIKDISLQCVYESLNKTGSATALLGNESYPTSGYPTIDNNNRAYITDGSGFAICIDLDSCKEIWSRNIAEILGYNKSTTKLRMRHTATLFNNSNGIQGIIFGTPNARSLRNGFNASEPCYAVALDIDTGNLLWSTGFDELSDYNCQPHGYMVDTNDHYAYGGMSMDNGREGINGSYNGTFIGKMVKIDLDDGEIIYKWYSVNQTMFNYTEKDKYNPYIYRGASIWNMPAIIDDYLVFGTANLWTYPQYIEECLLGNYDALSMDKSNCIDTCGTNRSSVDPFKWWRCLEYGVYPDSFVILNKYTFKVESITPLQGADVYGYYCRTTVNPLQNDPNCMKVQGFDGDLVAVAAYKNNIDNKLYAAAIQKSGQFYLFQVPSGKVMITKKISPWSNGGGGRWGIAVDTKSMIAIVTITGGINYPKPYKYNLMDGTILCNFTGSTHAIDLNTGNTLWQMINPWGTMNNDCSDVIYDEYVDYTLNTTCSYDINHNPFIYPPPINKNVSVILPPINESERNQIKSDLYQNLDAPATIVDDMVFIPSYSGDIFIHNLLNGKYIHHLVCPQRDLIKGGVSVVDDRVIFQCGNKNSSKLVSMKIK